MLHESKEVGVPPCGAAARRQALNVTRVLVGAKDVVDTVGSELVQYAGFSVGPAELSSPTSVGRSFLSRPPSPVSPSRMTIDGSALLRGRGSLLVEARSAGNQWSGRKPCAPGDFASPRDESNVWKGRKRIRSPTLGRAQSSGGPEPWPYPAEALTARSSRPSTSASTKRKGPGGVSAAALLRVNDGENCAQPCAKPLGGKVDKARPETGDNVAKHDVSSDGDQTPRNTQGPAETASAPVADHPGFLGAQENSRPVQEETQAGCRDEEAETTEAELVVPLPSEDRPSGTCDGRIGGGAWARDKDYPSVWSDSDSDVVGNGSSACFVAAAGTHDMENDSSVICDSTVSVANDGSAEQVAGKRSFSTLDSERYRGSLLSKDATNILRSHLESRSKPPGSCNSFVPDGRNAMATEGSVMMSPAPPPSPPGQVRPAGCSTKQTL